MITSKERYEKKIVKVKDHDMAYIDVGEGDPIVFLHGNPTSSYLWRNIIPYVEDMGRCIAPDLIGMGDSDKLQHSGPDSYRFAEHREYLDTFLDTLGINKNVILVVHDWGSALGFDWANRHRNIVKGIVYMEAIVRQGRREEMDESFMSFLDSVRSSSGEKMILEDNIFIEKLLSKMILRKLTEDEMNVYRRPYLESGESRRPTLTWPREIVLNGKPADVNEIINNYAEWLPTSKIPKLFINAAPGGILVGERREFCRMWRNQTEVTVKGIHYIQEDSPNEIGVAIAGWIENLEPANTDFLSR